MYAPGEYDLAGFAVGVVAKKKLIDGKPVAAGDKVLGLASSGLHSNGYSLARRVLFETMKLAPEDRPAKLGGKSVGEILLTPTRLYPKYVAAVLAAGVDVHAMTHITGGGLPGNLPRVLPDGLGVRLTASNWQRPAIIDLIAENVDEHELRRVFNLGIGYVLVLPPDQVNPAKESLAKLGESAIDLGEVITVPEGTEFEARVQFP